MFLAYCNPQIRFQMTLTQKKCLSTNAVFVEIIKNILKIEYVRGNVNLTTCFDMYIFTFFTHKLLSLSILGS